MDIVNITDFSHPFSLLSFAIIVFIFYNNIHFTPLNNFIITFQDTMHNLHNLSHEILLSFGPITEFRGYFE